MRFLFRDPVSEPAEVEPVVELLSDLRSGCGVATWTKRFTTGELHRSEALIRLR